MNRRCKSYHCEHCGDKVSKTVYYQHKMLYYDKCTQTWTHSDHTSPNSKDHTEKDFHISDTEESLSCEMEDLSEMPYDDECGSDSTKHESDSDAELDFNLDEDDVELVFDESDHPLSGVELHKDSRIVRIITLYIMFLFTWQRLFRVSDTGIGVLLAFFSTFLTLLVTLFGLSNLLEFVKQLPKNVMQARKYIGHNRDDFTKYVSCPKCHYVYDMDICKIKMPDGTFQSRKCTFVKFPNHPQAAHRKKCDAVLMKSVKTSAGTSVLYPYQVFCYKSIINVLRVFVKKPGFIERCELWRSRKVMEDTLCDVYDGRLWKEFMNPGGIPFLSLPYNFALTLNVDWFEPFKRSTYACGAMYMSILNLPREERYMLENILVGVIPGPHEPKKTMNSYLAPLVRELKQLWTGVVMESTSGSSVFVRAALLCTACDIPASRKVCGFVSHSAYRGCSRCLKPFPTAAFGEKADYSGFDRTTWEPRRNSLHRYHAYKHKDSKTAQKRKSIERDQGCQYSVLLELPYYDVIRMCVINPMHNLLLGTAHHVISVWKTRGLLNVTDIQDKVDAFITPSDVGRIPMKIQSGFSQFTAEQWRNWTLLYSLCSLKGTVPHRDYDCWLLFVKAASLLCQRSISLQQLDKADSFLMEFCETFERLYGEEHLNINLHLHGHLKECLLDFGPVYAFWLFSFERLNGILESYHTNCRDIPIQLMRRFLASGDFDQHKWPNEHRSTFSPLLCSHTYNKGSLTPSSLEQSLCHEELIQPLPPIYECSWEIHQKESLYTVIADITGKENFTILTLFNKVKVLSIGRFIISSVQSRYTTSCTVMARSPSHPNELHLAQIEYFAKVDVLLDPEEHTSSKSVCSVWIACIRFHFQHECKVWFGGPTQVWAVSLMSDVHFVPLQSIKCRVAMCKREVDFGRVTGKQKVLVVSPLS